MRTQHQHITLSLLAIFLFCTVGLVFTDSADSHGPCSSEERAEAIAYNNLQNAQNSLNAVYERSAEGEILTKALIGGVLGSIRGGAGGAAIGAAGGVIYATMSYTSDLDSAQQAVADASSAHDSAERALNECRDSNSETYDFLCPYCNNYWEFSSYDDLMNFHHDHQ